MGWLFSDRWRSRKELATYLLSGREFGPTVKVLGSSSAGNELWIAFEAENGARDLVLFLMKGDRGSRSWGYKDMSESMHPYYYRCSLKLLDLVPESCPEWRALVREGHAKRAAEAKAKRDLKSKLRVGATLRFNERCNPREVVVTSVEPLLGSSFGNVYRIPARLLKRVESVS